MKIINALIRRFNDAGSNARLKAVILFCIAVYAALMLGLGYAWYAHQWGSDFHFFDDLPEWKQMDKFAHFFWAFQVSALATRLMSWARLDSSKAVLIGSILGFLFVSSIEIPDGFSERYGASVFDMTANALGCAVFFAQHKLWKKVMVWPKFSFHTTALAPLRPVMLGDGFFEEVLKDYNGQTFWYSFSFEKLPLPKWLTLAVGVGAGDMIYGRDYQNEAAGFSPYRKYFLSVDINVARLQTSSKLFNAFLRIFNVIKFPAPAIEISTHGIKFHPIYF